MVHADWPSDPVRLVFFVSAYGYFRSIRPATVISGAWTFDGSYPTLDLVGPTTVY